MASRLRVLSMGLPASQTVENNLGKILTEIAALRAGKPTAIRVTTYYNMNIGNPNAPSDWS